jgi:hypothetical protein
MRHKMFEQPKYITNEQVKNNTPTNIKVTPINIILPKKLPQRDDNVWLSSPVRITQ